MAGRNIPFVSNGLGSRIRAEHINRLAEAANEDDARIDGIVDEARAAGVDAATEAISDNPDVIENAARAALDATPAIQAVTTRVDRVEPSAFDRSPRFNGVAPAVLKNKTAYLNDRADVDASGASAMGGIISTYLSEIRSVGNIGEVVSDAGSTYQVGATPITVPGGMVWEGGGRLIATPGGGVYDQRARIRAGAGATTLIQMPNRFATLRGLVIDGRTTPGIVLVNPREHYQAIEHCQLTDVPAGGAAIRGGGILYFTVDSSMVNALSGYGIDLRQAISPFGGSYYGVNHGTITRSYFYGTSEGFLRFDGMLNVRDNDFEGALTAQAIQLTGTVSTHLVANENYFELSGNDPDLGALLIGSGSTYVTFDGNLVYGNTIPGTTAAITFTAAAGSFQAHGNKFFRWHTGIKDARLQNNTGFSILGNFYSSVTTPVTFNSFMSTRLTAGTPAAVGIMADLSSMRVYGAGIHGSAVRYHDPVAHAVIDLARGNVHHLAYTGAVSPTATNARPGTRVTLYFENANATLTNATWHPKGGADVTPAAGTSREFFVDYASVIREITG